LSAWRSESPPVAFLPQFGVETTTDHGGYKIGNASPGVPSHLIFWDSYWGTTAGSKQANSLINFLGTFQSTAYLDGQHQYGLSYRAFESSDHPYFLNYSDPHANFRGSDLSGPGPA
jgi:hypothetical protein